MRRWMTTALLAAGLLAAASPATGQEQEHPQQVQQASVPSDVQKRVDALLSGIERIATDDDWAQLDAHHAVSALVSALNDNKRTVTIRGRAASALAHFPTLDAAAALRTVVSDPASPRHLVRKAMTSLTKIDDSDEAITVVAPHLGHKSKRVREDAIKAIGAVGSTAAHTVLRERLQHEESKHLRALLEAELAKPLKPKIEIESADLSTANQIVDSASEGDDAK